MNDELKLIELAKSGNLEATEQLFANYKTFIRLLARKFYLVGGDTDDLVQEGMMAFYKALNTYDATKNNNFRSYLKLVVNRHLVNIVKSANSYKYSPLNESFNLNDQGEVELGDNSVPIVAEGVDPETNILSEENIKLIHEKINSLLSDYEKQIFDLYMLGYNYVDIANQLQVSSKSVDNALNRIKNKLQFLKE